MKKKIIFLLIGLITCLSFSFCFKASYGALSQDWIAIEDFKNDNPAGLGIDSSGNIYVSGYMDNFSEASPKAPRKYDIFLLKYDSLGAKQWNRTYDVSERDMCWNQMLDNQDNIYLVGSTGLDDDSVLLIKYNSSGHLQWNKTWGEKSTGTSIKIDSFENIFVHGNVPYGNFLQKYDSSGNLLWNRTWKTPGNYYTKAMALDSSSNIYLGSNTVINETIYPITNIVLVKYNSLGEYQWNLTCQTPNREIFYDVIVDSLDNVYILGRIRHDYPLRDEIRLLKYDNSGNSIWNATWGNPELINSGNGLAVDTSDNIYITGSTYMNEVSGTDILVLKYNSTGDLKWNYTHGIRDLEGGVAIEIDSSENIYIYGNTKTIGYGGSYYDFDVFLLKLSKTESDQPFISGYNLPIVLLSVFGIGIAFYVKKRKSFL